MMAGARLPSGPPRPKPDSGDVTTWNDASITQNLRWAESVSWEPGQPGYRWWSTFRQELREEADKRKLRRSDA